MKINVLKFFLPFALTFGGLFAVVIPPFQSPDEFNHFFMAWRLGEGHLAPEKTPDQRLGAELPASLDSLRDAFLFLKNNYDARTSSAQIFNHLQLPIRPENRVFIDFPNTAIYAPTAYLPQAAACAVVRFFGAPPLWAVYFGRLANLVVWAFLVRAAIRSMPFQKWAIAFAALLPASLVMAASLNADVVSNGLCFWFSAFCVSRSYSGRLFFEKNNWPFPLLAVAVIGLNRVIYLPLVLLALLFFPKEKTQRKKRLRDFSILLAVGLAAAIFWSVRAGSLFISFDTYHPGFRDQQTLNEGVNPSAQVKFMLENPGAFATVAAKSFAACLPSMAAHLVGKFGWEKNYLPGWMLALLWLAFAAVIFSEKNPLSAGQRAWPLLALSLSLILFTVTMYALWSAVGATEMSNFQGRYFAPLVPAGVLLFGVAWFEKRSRKILFATLTILTFGEIFIISSALSRYYF